MNKKYFVTPSVTLLRLNDDVIVTSPNANDMVGNAQDGGILIPGRRRSIWD